MQTVRTDCTDWTPFAAIGNLEPILSNVPNPVDALALETVAEPRCPPERGRNDGPSLRQGWSDEDLF